MLLARTRYRFDISSTVLRDVFSRNDRWEVSGHLFRRDSDGDLWFMGSADSAVRSTDGILYLPPIENALSRVPVSTRSSPTAWVIPVRSWRSRP